MKHRKTFLILTFWVSSFILNAQINMFDASDSILALEVKGCSSIKIIVKNCNESLFGPIVNFNHSNNNNSIDVFIYYGTTPMSAVDMRIDTFTIVGLTSGQYYLNVMLHDNNNYINTLNSQFTIAPCFNPFEFETTNFCPDDGDILLKASQGYTSYLWLPGGETSESITVTTPGKYIIKVTDEFGNIYTDSIVVNSICPTCFIPNSFTPNGDGKNDVFKPICNDLVAYELLIFDRWGNRIYNTNNYNEAWDGNFGNELALQDVYVWMLTSKNIYGNEIIQRGHISLIR